jgi:hypothetical protein
LRADPDAFPEIDAFVAVAGWSGFYAAADAMQAAGGENFDAAVVFGLAGSLDAVQPETGLDGGDESRDGLLHKGLAVVGFAEPIAEVLAMRAGDLAADPAGKLGLMFDYAG